MVIWCLRLTVKYTIINYDAYKAKDFDGAYGYLAPDLKAIEVAILQHPIKEEVPAEWRGMGVGSQGDGGWLPTPTGRSAATSP